MRDSMARRASCGISEGKSSVGFKVQGRSRLNRVGRHEAEQSVEGQGRLADTQGRGRSTAGDGSPVQVAALC